MKITLEQVDKVIERCGVSYAEAKDALEKTNGDILDAIIFIENIKNGEINEKEYVNEKVETIEEIKTWLKGVINKGNVSRIKIRKDETVIADVPVNAGIAAAVIAIIIPAILAFVVVAAVVTEITIEITKEDGSVEVINKYVNKAVNEVKSKSSSIVDAMKNKVSNINMDDINKYNKKSDVKEEEINTFRYTINFEEE